MHKIYLLKRLERTPKGTFEQKKPLLYIIKNYAEIRYGIYSARQDIDDYSRNPCALTWFWTTMVLAMIFSLFSIGFPMDFHGESLHSEGRHAVRPSRRWGKLGLDPPPSGEAKCMDFLRCL